MIVVETGSRAIVVKDFRSRGVVVRNTIGWFSVWREGRALARLAGLSGIPELIGTIDRFAIAWVFVEGEPLPRLPRASLPASFFDALDRLLERVHERGVGIADLHHRNVLRTTGADPALIDFSLAVLRPRGAWNLPMTWAFARASELDRLAARRIRARYQERGADGSAAAPDPDTIRQPAFYRFGRALKRWIARARGRTRTSENHR